ncbi:MAG: class I SAM-dependent methyltransferase, partial [Flavobacteriaceae bacterium]|nr:class I SAM-dependent methyltransferase [Flavobacteriaceae bacterium]
MLFQIKSYLTFFYRSKNQHGVHSPFVFDLITKCFYEKNDFDKLKRINHFRNNLLQRKDFINVTDFGKGSKIFKSNKRQVSKIAKVAGISKKKSKLLIRLISYLAPNNALEIGTSLGIGTASIALGNKNTKVTSLEGCPNTANIAKDLLKKHQLNNTKIIVGDFKKTLFQEINNTEYDFVYFDGNHQKKPTLEYFELCLKNVKNETVFVFDDINWSKEMQEAWTEIKNHPKVTVTIDTY